MTYQEALEYINSVAWQGSRPGLERITVLMNALGNVQDNLKYIHIAGTNGKGSVSAMLTQVLTAAGFRTGLFTSPYIARFNERMQIDGVPIPDEVLADIVAQLRPAADAMEDKPTEFELITAAAFLWFAREKCDIVVLETGMGGRLDATNLIKTAECAVITNIGLDHTEYLGDTIGKIAWEKAGILKTGVPTVVYDNEEEAMAVIRDAAQKQGSALSAADFTQIVSLRDSLEGQTFRYKNSPELSMTLLGAHQLKNAAVALETVEVLRSRGWNIPDDALVRGFAAVRWPARFEVVSHTPLTILDGAHNPQGIECLCECIAQYLPERRIVFLVGVLEDKDWQEMMDRLKEVSTDFVIVQPPSPRALKSGKLAGYLADRDHRTAVADSITTGVEGAMFWANQCKGAVVACGSLYMMGEARAYFEDLL